MSLSPIEPPFASTNPGVRVLLVDDDPSITRSFERLLTLAGNAVTTAANGRQAIGLVESTAFDVVVSDIEMPGLDGLSMLRAIRQWDKDVPVVFMTGRPALDGIMAAMDHGAFRYLTKPVDGSELIGLVERAAQLHRLALVSREASDRFTGKSSDRDALESRFNAALEKMWMAMQPILSWNKRQTFAYEALLRTDEPTLRSPLDFVEAAERLRRTDELGRRVRQKIADQLSSLPPKVNVFVNLHPTDLIDPELTAATGALTPFSSRVVLEVTERAALEKIPGIAASVQRLRQLGFRIALDDLGAGYAGLSSFALLEPEIVKVDMSLVRDIHQSPTKQKIFRSFTALCRDLETDLVAEGVENAEERDCLTSLGGDLYQGYLFCRPGRGFPAPVY
jgi:EAL domain-containing protein (putative c-di-GMP-specific phosphodiesterase class I)/ActR/RegA family two-component response regulator